MTARSHRRHSWVHYVNVTVVVILMARVTRQASPPPPPTSPPLTSPPPTTTTSPGDEGIPTPPAAEGDVRVLVWSGLLEPNSNILFGRLEVYHNNVWGAVCNDNWGEPDARVACRQLGYSYSTALNTPLYPFPWDVLPPGIVLLPGPELWWLTDLGCTGAESRLSDCPPSPWGSLEQACDSHTEAFLACSNEGLVTDPPLPSDTTTIWTGTLAVITSYRLVGSSSSVGRLEVRRITSIGGSGEWGTVCNEGFTVIEANVACRSLGFGEASGVVVEGTPGSGSIWFYELRCSGMEYSLAQCSFAEWGNSDCDHSQDVSIACRVANTLGPVPPTVPPQLLAGSIRLVGGATDHVGRLEIFHDDQWGTVCDDSFGPREANATCSQLGFMEGGQYLCCASAGQGSGPIWADGVSCPEGSATLSECSFRGWGNHGCSHSDDVSVNCYENGVLAPWPTTTTSSTEGTTIPPWIPLQGDLRLVGGNTPSQGRLEIFHDNQWGTICSAGFHVAEADAACRQLGFPEGGAAECCAAFGLGSGPVWASHVICPEGASRLSDCTFSGWGSYVGSSYSCSHDNDVGVNCLEGGTTAPLPTQPTIMAFGALEPGSIRLVNDVPGRSGRLEILHDNQWGTVCDDGFGSSEASAVCRVLGFPGGGYPWCCASFGRGTGPIWADDVRCATANTPLSQCTFRGWGSHSCTHGQDVSVVCYTGGVNDSVPTTQFMTTVVPLQPFGGDLRIVGANSPHQGRLEVYHDNEWGTICGIGFSDYEANAACRQIGFSEGGTSHCCDGSPDQGQDRIWASGVSCPAGAATMAECTFRGWGNHGCTHWHDARVSCREGGTAHTWPPTSAHTTVWHTDVTSHTTRAPAFPIGPLAQGSVRLVGPHTRSGRLELRINNQWGTVCDDHFNSAEANATCKHLGFPEGGVAYCCAAYGAGSGAIVADDVSCPPGSDNLAQCTFLGWGNHNCGHHEDVAVSCFEGGILEPLPSTHTPEWTTVPHLPLTGDLRLVGGNTPSQGRLEIFHDNQWGTICSSGFHAAEAAAACRQLGYPEGGGSQCCAMFGQGTGRIWASNVQCPDGVSSMADCTFPGWGFASCSHANDVSVNCNEGGTMAPYPSTTTTTTSKTTTSGPIDFGILQAGSVRLVGGPDIRSGRLEINYNNQWGTVCDDYFGPDEANTICKHLGFPEGGVAYCCAAYGAGSGAIVADDVNCPPGADNLAQCTFRGWGNHNCGHGEDVAVGCLDGGTLGPLPSTFTPVWTTTTTLPRPTIPLIGDLRLVGGNTPSQGRLEIFHDNQWGTICSSGFHAAEAAAACRQLGYPEGGGSQCCAMFGQGTGRIWASNVQCPDGVSSMADCTFPGWGFTSCSHSNDVSVNCNDGGTMAPYPSTTTTTTSTTTTPGQIHFGILQAGSVRLVGGPDIRSGRLEINYSNQWGTVCDDYFGPDEANTICKHLGFPEGGVAYCCAAYGAGSGAIVADDVNCPPGADNLAQCTFRGWGNHNCGHYEDVAVSCLDGGTLGPLPSTFTPVLTTTTTLPRPTTPLIGSLRLVGGVSPSQGRLEILHDNQWGTVCHNGFYVNEAKAACRQLGYPEGGEAQCCARFGPGTGPVWASNVHCPPGVSTMADCVFSGWGASCSHWSDVSINCLEAGSSHPWPSPTTAIFTANTGVASTVSGPVNGHSSSGTTVGTSIPGGTASGTTPPRVLSTTTPSAAIGSVGLRLANRTTTSSFVSGRVEVLYNGQWGTVCDDNFGNQDATVVCRQLGFTCAGEALCCAARGRGSGPIWLDNLQCTGLEAELGHCGHNGMGVHNCGHSEDAAVRCPVACNEQSDVLRLVGGSGPHEGRVEIFLNDQWGTVCDDYWGDQDARVVCRQLGYTSGTGMGFASFGPGSGQIWLDNVECDGTESSLVDCHHNGQGQHNCHHYEDAGVVCSNTDPSTLHPSSPSPPVTNYTSPLNTDSITTTTTATTTGTVVPPTGGGTPACGSGQVYLGQSVGGASGAVHYCHGGQWGLVCADTAWSQSEARVVCNQLGYSNGQALVGSTFPGTNGRFVLRHVTCTGSEAMLGQCMVISGTYCVRSLAAGVICSHDPNPNSFQVRVAGDVIPDVGVTGLLEVALFGVWGTVCDDQFNDTAARVVCGELGYPTGRRLISRQQGSGPIWMSDVQCQGSEASIHQCPFPGYYNHTCSHAEDVGVQCESYSGPWVRVVDGTATSGIVEVYEFGVWKRVCGDNVWRQNNARVLCRELGLAGGVAMWNTTRRLDGAMENPSLTIGCRGDEDSLYDCERRALYRPCDLGEARVICQAPSDPEGAWPQLRLSGGDTPAAGRVEVGYGGVWGWVGHEYCNDNNNIRKVANVICRDLGFPGGDVVLSQFPASDLPHLVRWPGYLTCSGQEGRLVECPRAFNDSYWDRNDQYNCASDSVQPYAGLQVQCGAPCDPSDSPVYIPLSPLALGLPVESCSLRWTRRPDLTGAGGASCQAAGGLNATARLSQATLTVSVELAGPGQVQGAALEILFGFPTLGELVSVELHDNQQIVSSLSGVIATTSMASRRLGVRLSSSRVQILDLVSGSTVLDRDLSSVITAGAAPRALIRFNDVPLLTGGSTPATGVCFLGVAWEY